MRWGWHRRRVREALLVVVAAQALSACTDALPVSTEWQTSAMGRLQELETTLGTKERQLLRVREELAVVRGAEERGGRRKVRRAAFDVGSAACKIVVADVDLHAGSFPNITETVYSDRVPLQLSDDLAMSEGSTFSEAMLRQLREVLYEFKHRAAQHGAEQYSGVATAAFRKASNGPAFLLQLRDEGLPLRLISQDREAFLGFLTANHHCPDVAAYDLVSWDCGGGSFQITAEVPPAWESWMKSMGTSVAKTLLLTKVQGKGVADSPNPVALSDAQALAKELKVILGEPPEWLTSKIVAPGVHFAAIGGETSMFRLASELVESRVITKVQLLEAVENLCGKSDLQLRLMEDVPAAMNQPQLVIPKLVLLYSVLNALDCDEVTFYNANGNTPGILMTQELWE